MTPSESTTVAVELERLRGSVETGFAKLNGRLDTALQRTTQTEKDIEELEQRVTAMEKNRWPLPAMAALTGLAGLGASLYTIAAR